MDKNGVYIASIESFSYKNFNQVKNIRFLKENKEIYPWTIFLGNNGTGKTNLLKFISSFEPFLYKTKNEKKFFFPKVIGSPTIKKCAYSISFFSPKDAFNWNWSGSTDHPKEAPINANGTLNLHANNLTIYAYGINRRVSKKDKISNTQDYNNNETLFNTEVSLINLNEWLLQTDYAVKNGQAIAQKRLDLIRKVITGNIFPEIQDFRFITDESFNSSVEFKTNEGWFQLDDLGYGYQSTLSWVVDFCKKMFDRYPKSENPLQEPAIVLIDEIDLHLHPEWQRNITRILSNLFPKTQFIATTHSPLVVQSLEDANVYVLNKEGKEITIDRMPNTSFKGWSVEDILNKVMGLGSRVKSDTYLNLIETFDKGLDNFDYDTSKQAYDQLIDILPENDIQRRIIDMQIKQFPQER